MNDNYDKEVITNDNEIPSIGGKHGKLLGIMVLIWFFGSMIAMGVLGSINPLYSLMVFGQFFLVFGVIILCIEDKVRWLSLPFLLVGLACIIIPMFILNPNILKVEIIWESVVPVLLIIGFVLTGLGMTIIPIIRKKKLEKVCIVPVYATITRYDTTYSDDGNKLYCPIYSYEYGKKTYEVSDNVYTNVEIKPIGTIQEFKINPNKPDQYLDSNSFTMKFLIILGILFLIVSIPILIFLLTTFDFIK